MERIRNFLKDESGANMVEYALLLALIAVVSIGIITELGQSIQSKFQEANNALQ